MSDSLVTDLRSPPSMPSARLGRVITDTGELRWFAAGLIPPEVLAWFGPGWGRGAVEERCDVYRLGGHADIGLKRRAGERLELKVRQRADEVEVELGPGLRGRLEGWRRWSPAPDLAEVGPDDEWLDVAKTILKRRILDDGVEAPVESELPNGDFCDVELVELEIGGARWWSLALTANGAPAIRPTCMQVAWGVVASVPPPPALTSAFDESQSYPALLAGDPIHATWPAESGVTASI